jgi:hypothetical protein
MARIKGQEVQVILTKGGVLETTFTDIKNFEMGDQYDTLDVGYLGEKTNRKDYVFRGARFSCELHLSTKEFWTFKQAIKDKAKRITPDVIFNISGIFNFDDGTSIAETLEDVSWGPVPTNVPERGDYVNVRMEGVCSDTSTQDL